MGGLGSGPWLGKSTSIVLEKCLHISVKTFSQEGIFKKGDGEGTITWQKPIMSSVGFKLHTSKDGTKKIYFGFSYKNSNTAIRETIWLQTTRPHFGGLRWWFTCPGCGKRVAFLYLPPGGSLFLCRTCYGLSYISQRRSPYNRLFVKAQSIRRDLNGTDSLSDSFPEKPKGMHWLTYTNKLLSYTELMGQLDKHMKAWS